VFVQISITAKFSCHHFILVTQRYMTRQVLFWLTLLLAWLILGYTFITIINQIKHNRRDFMTYQLFFINSKEKLQEVWAGVRKRNAKSSLELLIWFLWCIWTRSLCCTALSFWKLELHSRASLSMMINRRSDRIDFCWKIGPSIHDSSFND
jgi:hypothetical protein